MQEVETRANRHNEIIEGNPLRVISMSRETLFLCGISLLAIMTTASSYHWLETHERMNSRQALQHAQHHVERLNQTGQPLELSEIRPPSGNQSEWRISYRQKQGKKLTLSVQESGQTRLL